MRNSSKSSTQRTVRLISAWALVLMLLSVGAGTAIGGPQTASSNPQQLNFGPFSCEGCPSKIFTHHFIAQPGLYQMVVFAEGVGSAKIILNGQVVFGPGLFPDHPIVLGAFGPLDTHNTLKIKVWDNSFFCKVWVIFKPLPQTPPPQPPAPTPAPTPTPTPTPDPCDPCSACDPCEQPAPQPQPQPQPDPCEPCSPCDPCPQPAPEPDPCGPGPCDPDPCGNDCGPSTFINQVNGGNGDNRNNVAIVDNDWGFYPYGRTTVNQVNGGDGDNRDNIVDLQNAGGAGSYTIVNQLNMGNGDDRGNIFEGVSTGGCGPGGCTKINQVNLGDGNGRFNLASMLAQW